MAFREKYTVEVVYHFDPEEVVKAKAFDNYEFTLMIVARSGSLMTKSSTYDSMHTEPSKLFRMTSEESNLEATNPVLRNRCVIFEF